MTRGIVGDTLACETKANTLERDRQAWSGEHKENFEQRNATEGQKPLTHIQATTTSYDDHD